MAVASVKEWLHHISMNLCKLAMCEVQMNHSKQWIQLLYCLCHTTEYCKCVTLYRSRQSYHFTITLSEFIVMFPEKHFILWYFFQKNWPVGLILHPLYRISHSVKCLSVRTLAILPILFEIKIVTGLKDKYFVFQSVDFTWTIITRTFCIIY